MNALRTVRDGIVLGIAGLGASVMVLAYVAAALIVLVGVGYWLLLGLGII